MTTIEAARTSTAAQDAPANDDDARAPWVIVYFAGVIVAAIVLLVWVAL